jgi:hypothetical protein
MSPSGSPDEARLHFHSLVLGIFAGLIVLFLIRRRFSKR